MKRLGLIIAATAALTLSACGKSNVSCSDDNAKGALEAAIREGLEKVAVERAKANDGSQLISNSEIRAAIGQIKLVIENIRTTKEDPNSTKRFCTGNLKIVFPASTFKDADRSRELAGLTTTTQMADSASVEKGADYLKSDLDYNVQPTDDGQKVIAEFENANSKLDVFGEVVAASLLKSRIETENRMQQEQAALADKQQQDALSAERNATLEQAMVARKTADASLNTIWQALEPQTRQQLLAQQRAWIKQKDASCKVRGLQGSTDPTEQRSTEAQCQAEASSQRASELQQYVGGDI